MGSLKGHALPGCFFLIAGLWWAGRFSLWFATRRNKSLGSTRLTSQASRSTQHRLEIIEGSTILFFSVVGMLAEQFGADGPWLCLYDHTEHHWEKLHNWQHSTMYLFFGVAGAFSIIVHSTEAAPLALDRLMLAMAFFMEGFLFLYHLHGRAMLDVHVHQLLLFSVFGEALVSFLEVFHRGNILLELLRASLTILQGSWFWQVSLVLADWFCAVPPQWSGVGLDGPQQHDVHHRVLLLAPSCGSAGGQHGLLHCQLCGEVQTEEDSPTRNGSAKTQGERA